MAQVFREEEVEGALLPGAPLKGRAPRKGRSGHTVRRAHVSASFQRWLPGGSLPREVEAERGDGRGGGEGAEGRSVAIAVAQGSACCAEWQVALDELILRRRQEAADVMCAARAEAEQLVTEALLSQASGASGSGHGKASGRKNKNTSGRRAAGRYWRLELPPAARRLGIHKKKKRAEALRAEDEATARAARSGRTMAAPCRGRCAQDQAALDALSVQVDHASNRCKVVLPEDHACGTRSWPLYGNHGVLAMLNENLDNLRSVLVAATGVEQALLRKGRSDLERIFHWYNVTRYGCINFSTVSARSAMAPHLVETVTMETAPATANAPARQYTYDVVSDQAWRKWATRKGIPVDSDAVYLRQSELIDMIAVLLASQQNPHILCHHQLGNMPTSHESARRTRPQQRSSTSVTQCCRRRDCCHNYDKRANRRRELRREINEQFSEGPVSDWFGTLDEALSTSDMDNDACADNEEDSSWTSYGDSDLESDLEPAPEEGRVSLDSTTEVASVRTAASDEADGAIGDQASQPENGEDEEDDDEVDGFVMI